ncbi:Spermine/spermidine synthase [Microbulbifer donghaiensis]|uniref:Spermine/spermidine synthase n=1 Tax=Microbulbifer donghaiensis TaxID=494016 RepID=A0A1M4XE09_9GAMM|nr:MnmC family methyltransferase [Microbulbifer donghaiensis]SHE91683.1 Spermine/spermidine synthase [Microbulbifer donghaiensis]
MKPWVELGTAHIPNGGGILTLRQREQEFSISLSGPRGELMNSRRFNSERELSLLGCAHLKQHSNARVVVGGMGMGYTLAAALEVLPPDAEVIVADLIPEVVEWNRGPLGACAGRPLDDSRCAVHIGDVRELLEKGDSDYDAVLLDVDNGPEGLTKSDNNWLYSLEGTSSIYESLTPGGMLAVWSAGPDTMYVHRLKKTGFDVEVKTVRERPGKGARHTIFLARKTSM